MSVAKLISRFLVFIALEALSLVAFILFAASFEYFLIFELKEKEDTFDIKILYGIFKQKIGEKIHRFGFHTVTRPESPASIFESYFTSINCYFVNTLLPYLGRQFLISTWTALIFHMDGFEGLFLGMQLTFLFSVILMGFCVISAIVTAFQNKVSKIVCAIHYSTYLPGIPLTPTLIHYYIVESPKFLWASFGCSFLYLVFGLFLNLCYKRTKKDVYQMMNSSG